MVAGVCDLKVAEGESLAANSLSFQAIDFVRLSIYWSSNPAPAFELQRGSIAQKCFQSLRTGRSGFNEAVFIKTRLSRVETANPHDLLETTPQKIGDRLGFAGMAFYKHMHKEALCGCS